MFRGENEKANVLASQLVVILLSQGFMNGKPMSHDNLGSELVTSREHASRGEGTN
jgi:hypothetical protein